MVLPEDNKARSKFGGGAKGKRKNRNPYDEAALARDSFSEEDRKGFKTKKVKRNKRAKTIAQQLAAVPKITVKLADTMTVRELALRSNMKSVQIINKLIDIGGIDEASGASSSSFKISPYMLTQLRLEARTGRGRLAAQQVSAAADALTISADVAELLMEELGFETAREVQRVQDETRTNIAEALEANSAALKRRAPIVTVMGHVDHGKTSLLDALRNTSVADGEDGGITQAVGAFKFPLGNESIVFLDTPGHAAFASMRKCGSMLTDIIVLVVAATDGVRAQTLESIELANTAKVPMIVALSKVDSRDVDQDEAFERITDQLAMHGVRTERIGGDVQMVPIAAPKGIGLEELSEAIALQAEVMDLRADPSARGEAIVLESRLDQHMGSLTDVVSLWGTLRVGDHVVCGEQLCRIRQLLDTVTGKQMKEVPPGTPARLVGFGEPATPGMDVLAVPNVKRAREVVDLRKRRREQAEMDASAREQQQKAAAAAVAADGDAGGDEPGPAPLGIKVPVLLKADTDGSMEALRYSIDALDIELQETARLAGLGADSGFQVIRRGVGPVTSSDVELAKAFGAHIFAFNVRASTRVVKDAAAARVNLVSQSVIYHLLDDLQALAKERTPAEIETKVLGRAKVLQVFEMKARRRSEGAWFVAGSTVVEGVINKNARLRVVRDDEIIHKSGLDSLRHYKEDVNEVTKGHECGISLSSFQEFQEGDIIECYEEVAVPK